MKTIQVALSINLHIGVGYLDENECYLVSWREIFSLHLWNEELCEIDDLRSFVMTTILSYLLCFF